MTGVGARSVEPAGAEGDADDHEEDRDQRHRHDVPGEGTEVPLEGPVALVDSIAPPASMRRKHVVHVIFAADVTGSLEDVVSQDEAIRGHRAFRLQELDTIALHPPIQRFLQRWQPGDPAVYLGEMWVP